jgi:CRP-like cAMP-binding protein
MLTTALIALAAGVASAVALPLGAALGLAFRPSARVTSALMAFGAGALLFALSVEIVAQSMEHAGFLPLALGGLTGGAVFQLANGALGEHGAFLRKMAVAARYLTREKSQQAEALLHRLSGVHLLQALEPEEIALLVPSVRPVALQPGAALFHEGDAGSSLYLIEEGEVSVTRGGVQVAVLRAGDTVGEMALVTGAPRVASIRALTASRLLLLPKHAFDELLARSPLLRERVDELVRLRVEELKHRLLAPQAEAEEWERRAARRLRQELRTSRAEVHEAAAARGGTAARGIWLGNLLDAVPEALVLGTTATAATVSMPLLAGIFLANFPEAMSGSELMRSGGMNRRRILVMWGSIVPVAGFCAVFGSLFLGGMGPQAFGFVEGAAAGAMLVMIAETMLPEAFERGGAVVGLSTLLGFLAALGIKSIA